MVDSKSKSEGDASFAEPTATIAEQQPACSQQADNRLSQTNIQPTNIQPTNIQPTNTQSFDPAQPPRPKIKTLIIGCGNLLRGDDAAGPVLIRRIWERGLPADVHCADGGTGGMDVAFQMRGVPHVILVDACQSDSEPGSLFELPGEEVEQLPPLQGLNLHAFRWDHALAFGRWLLKEDYPARVSVFLIEGANFEVGTPLSLPVDLAIDTLVDQLFERVIGVPKTNAIKHEDALQPACPVPATTEMDHAPQPAATAPAQQVSLMLELDAEGYLRLSREAAQQYFPEDSLVPLWREERLYLLPTRGAAAGGLLLKQRNPRGDRSLLISEIFQFAAPVGTFRAVWDSQLCGLEVILNPSQDHQRPANDSTAPSSHS